MGKGVNPTLSKTSIKIPSYENFKCLRPSSFTSTHVALSSDEKLTTVPFL